MDATELLTQAPGERIVTDSPGGGSSASCAGAGRARVLVFTGRHSADANGGRRFIEQAALEAGRETVRFSDIEAEPAIGTIEKMTALIRQEKPPPSLRSAAAAPWTRRRPLTCPRNRAGRWRSTSA